MAPDTAQHLASYGFSGSYTVILAPYGGQTTGSVLTVTATGSAKAIAQGTLLAVTNEIHTKLAGLQAGISRRDRIRAVTLSATGQAALSTSHTVRSLAVLIVVGLAISFGVPRVVDTQIAGRRARREARRAATAPYPASPLDDRPLAVTSTAVGRSPAGAGGSSVNGAGSGITAGSTGSARGTNRPV